MRAGTASSSALERRVTKAGGEAADRPGPSLFSYILKIIRSQ